VDGQLRVRRDALVEAAEERAAAREDDPRAADVGRELGRRRLERADDGLDDRADGLRERREIGRASCRERV